MKIAMVEILMVEKRRDFIALLPSLTHLPGNNQMELLFGLNFILEFLDQAIERILVFKHARFRNVGARPGGIYSERVCFFVENVIFRWWCKLEAANRIILIEG